MSIATVTPIHAQEADRPDRSRRPARRVGLEPGVGPRPARVRQPAVRVRPVLLRPAGAVRLTRRGRVVAQVGVVALVCAAVLTGVLAISRQANASSSSPGPPTVYHVVLPGETLWGIAAVEAPGSDRREAVARIAELNALPGGRVFAGQRLAIRLP